jgi:fluoroquinolone transport system permease protein
MKPLVRSFRIFINQIFKDSMLAVVCIAPILTACFFRFGIPAVEKILCEYFQETTILADYYLLFDLFLSLITPYLLCFASAMVMLTEFDENIANYLAVTPVGKKGYVVSRLLFPALISVLASVLLMSWFTLTIWTLGMVALTCLLTSLLGMAVALLILSFSHNRVEGMAMAKLAGLLMLGLIVPFFLRSGVQYLLAPLPSFWIAKLCMKQNILFLLPSMLTSLIWGWFLYRRFKYKFQ